MTTLINFLKGKKAYILGLLGVIYALSGFLTSNLDSKSALEIAWGALSLMAVRAGIANSLATARQTLQ